MLENKQQTSTLQAESMINNEVIVTFTSRIPYDGIANPVSVQIRDKNLYDENKTKVRKDQQEFQMWVWEKEDELNQAAVEEE